jgi:hypothetical protein
MLTRSPSGRESVACDNGDWCNERIWPGGLYLDTRQQARKLGWLRGKRGDYCSQGCKDIAAPAPSTPTPEGG